jgi:hypothetical protein
MGLGASATALPSHTRRTRGCDDAPSAIEFAASSPWLNPQLRGDGTRQIETMTR